MKSAIVGVTLGLLATSGGAVECSIYDRPGYITVAQPGPGTPITVKVVAIVAGYIDPPNVNGFDITYRLHPLECHMLCPPALPMQNTLGLTPGTYTVHFELVGYCETTQQFSVSGAIPAMSGPLLLLLAALVVAVGWFSISAPPR